MKNSINDAIKKLSRLFFSFKEWVTASEIRIQLVRMNTFGDEMFGQPAVLRTYFYAISDLAVGGR